jgi:hypothetical protein
VCVRFIFEKVLGIASVQYFVAFSVVSVVLLWFISIQVLRDCAVSY